MQHRELLDYIQNKEFVLLHKKVDSKGRLVEISRPELSQVKIDNDKLISIQLDREINREYAIETDLPEYKDFLRRIKKDVIFEKVIPHNGFKTIMTWYEA